MALTPGFRLGPYDIVAPLGAGGMGEVWRAHDPRLGRDVAIKLLPTAVAGDPDRLARLEREARTVAGLNHPNIVVLHTVEEADGVRFLTMELVEGTSLAHQVQPGGLPVGRVLDLAIPLADALAAAHERGVVHRDLKPANVMVTPEGRIKVLDFGLARSSARGPELDVTRALTATSPLSPSGDTIGTVPYMAPEQFRGGPVDARTDLFSLGIVLFELLTGRRPFQGATPADVSTAILRDPAPALGGLRPDLPGDLARIIARCLEKDPEQRFQTAKDVRNELELVRRGLDTKSAAPSPPAEASVAVLPFANRSRDESDEYFADGITEDVIAQLCKIRTLKVISRASVMPFKQREASLAEIAGRLQVRNVLEGSVRRVGDRVRIVAQLVDAVTGQSLWAETYDRRLTDIFEIQSDVSLHIAEGLKAQLTPSEQERIRREPTQDVKAYEHYLRGRHELVRFTAPSMLKSIEHFERALERDPRLALAHAGIAFACTELSEVGAMRREEAGPRAMAAASTAVALDPERGEAHSALANVKRTFEFDWAGSEAGFKRALELSPNSADTYDLYGRLCAGLARHDEAVALLRRAYELDPVAHRSDLSAALMRAGRDEEALETSRRSLEINPNDPRLRATYGWALFRNGRVAEGLAELERAAALSPDLTVWRAQLGMAYALAGRTGQALEIRRELEDPSRPRPTPPYHLAYIDTGLGEIDRALDHLERAIESGEGAVSAIKGSFLFAPLRTHPRFLALLRRLRLA